jgi:signal transduction histidine kinase/DNA-binding response OmpR family regulator
LAAFLVVFLIVRWRSAKLVKEKERLDKVIEERTREIKLTNAQLHQKTLLLEEQSEKLKEMDKIKSRFFANISHEFRTPLTLIMGPLDNLREELPDEGVKKQVDLASRNSRRLLGLINQLLDLSKFESGEMKLRAVREDLVRFLSSLIEPFEPVAGRHNLNFSFHGDLDSIEVYFDPEKLEKIMANLLSNALKFTPPGGRITVSLSAPVDPGGEVVISVKDTGMGIPGDQLSHIFDRFYQAEVTVEHHRKGSGIGLALVKELVDLHHGELSVQSDRGKESGTEFQVRLKLGRSHLTDAEIAARRDSQAEEPPEPAELIEPVIEPGHAAPIIDALTGAAEPRPDRTVVLVVEDSADLRQYIRGSLEPDYAVEEAPDGKIGIEKAKQLIPDLVISDIMMPEADGYELCRALKGDVSTSHIPVVLLTAKASEENVVRGLETGADDYITKPFSTRILSARIRNLIELRRQLQLKLNREMILQPSRIAMSEMDREFLKDLQEVIEKNLSDPDFNVEDLSKRLYMSRTTVYRKIQALSGETPTDFIRSYRLMRAAQLLKNNYGSVTDVAFEVGFSSRAYFTKCFKDKFQRLPSEYLQSESGAGS